MAHETPKSYTVKAYNPAGTQLLRTWEDVANIGSFSMEVNAGLSELGLSLPRPWGGLGEPGEENTAGDLAFDSLVRVYVFDKESSLDGDLIYQGTIQEYEIVAQAGGQLVDLSLVPRTRYLGARWIEDPINLTTLSPSGVVQYLITNGYLPGITWNAGNPASSGLVWPVNIEETSVKDALDQMRDLAGETWYYLLLPDNSLVFQDFDLDAAEHVWTIGREVTEVTWRRTQLDRKRRVYIFGAVTEDPAGAPVRIQDMVTEPGYNPADSVLGPRDDVIRSDNIFDQSTARRIAMAHLAFANRVGLEGELILADSNYSETGYDLESVFPGQVVKVLNPNVAVYDLPRWDAGWVLGSGWRVGGEWAYQTQQTAVIVKTENRGTEMTVTLSRRPFPLYQAFLAQSDVPGGRT